MYVSKLAHSTACFEHAKLPTSEVLARRREEQHGADEAAGVMVGAMRKPPTGAVPYVLEAVAREGALVAAQHPPALLPVCGLYAGGRRAVGAVVRWAEALVRVLAARQSLNRTRAETVRATRRAR